MTWIEVSRDISSPADKVFATVSDIRNFSEAVPHIVKYEFLSEVQSGVGTKFRETRRMNGRDATTELEVTEYQRDEHVRMVADSHGTVWDTVFRVTPAGEQTRLTIAMDARAYKLLPKLMNPMIKGMVRKAVAKDLEYVKLACES